ncbi:MAG: hypothetical protein WD069_00820 [Planctomycetales bacterium]
MAAEVIFVPESTEDVREARAWYEARRSGLGIEFVECLEERLQSIDRRVMSLKPVARVAA